MSVSVQATFCATLVDEWAQNGVTEAVVCPGSRSTPMAVALATRLRVHVRLDERSAAFYAPVSYTHLDVYKRQASSVGRRAYRGHRKPSRSPR